MSLVMWLVITVLSIAVIVLILIITVERKSMDELRKEYHEVMTQDTNAKIRISAYNSKICKLASEIDRDVEIMRVERHRLRNGDRELKEAVTNISHDLRTPLTAISGYLDLLEEEELNENAVRYIGVIRERTESLKNLTEELFRYSVAVSDNESLNLQRLCLNDELQIALAGYFGVLKEKGIEPVIIIPEERIERNADKAAIQRIFNNILSNSAKYSDGDLLVTLDHTGRITFSNSSKSLSEIDVGKLFDRFYTVTNGKNSTGLGLSIAKQLTESMQGTIKAEYRDGKISIYVAFE